eukprot:58255-Prorocentrum_lima.AAC.1
MQIPQLLSSRLLPDITWWQPRMQQVPLGLWAYSQAMTQPLHERFKKRGIVKRTSHSSMMSLSIRPLRTGGSRVFPPCNPPQTGPCCTGVKSQTTGM